MFVRRFAFIHSTQATVDCWPPETELRTDSLRILLSVLTDDLQDSPDTASLVVAELLPLVHVQLHEFEPCGSSDSARSGPTSEETSSRCDAISVLSHPMIFKSVIPPVQRLASYSESVSLGSVCPHALPCTAAIWSAAQPWLRVHASVSLASKLSDACEKITQASGTDSSALLASAAILCACLERHKDATSLLHMAVRYKLPARFSLGLIQ